MLPSRQVLYCALALAASLLWFEFTPSDATFQHLLFDEANRRWLWSSREPVARLLLYDGIKGALILFGLTLAAGLAMRHRLARLYRYAAGMRVVLLSLILVPSGVAALKATTNVACPRNVVEFGGEIVHVGPLGRYPATIRPASRQRCFPAGHASAGFALLSLYFLFLEPRHRRRAACGALALGWAMGGYKMAIGDHFLSHTITSMLLAWLIINLIVIAQGRVWGYEPDRHVTDKRPIRLHGP